MESKIKGLVDKHIKELGLFIDSVVLEKEGSQLFLRICLDSNDIIDLDKIVKATKIINPIIDENDFVDEKYILEIYGKSKGSGMDEC